MTKLDWNKRQRREDSFGLREAPTSHALRPATQRQQAALKVLAACPLLPLAWCERLTLCMKRPITVEEASRVIEACDARVQASRR